MECAFEVDGSFLSTSKVILFCSSVVRVLSSGLLSHDSIMSETGGSFPGKGSSSWEAGSL